MKVELLFITPQAQRLIESAGRTCYQSFDRQSEDSDAKFVRMILKAGHDSVMEHAFATFRISGVSRAFTHQLVRHRLASFSQQSQRYVNEKSFGYVTPDAVTDNPEAAGVYAQFMDHSREVYLKLQELGVRNEDARFVLPNAVESEIVISANLREWRHIIALRGGRGAQWEIRRMAIACLDILKGEAPAVFADLEVDRDKEVIRKVEL